MNQKLRKAFVSSVMFTMVFALSGVATVNPVSAAASAGDLIKMKGLDTIYYLGADGKRYVFPNAQTYFSWYPDFSTVITVPQSELESYRLGANVTMRAATKLVKITTDPTVYAVEPNGTLKSIVSEANAKALFGDAWAKRVIDVADAFFTNYSVKTPLEVGKYPVGSVVQSGTNKFYYDGTNYRQIASDAAFSANRFQTANVVSTTATITASGTALAGAEAALINTGAGAATVGVTPGAGTGLSVALAATTPASGTVLADSTSADGAQALISVATVNFVAAADGAVQVNKVNFKRAGVPSTDTDFAEFYLYDGKTLLAKYSSISSGVLTFSNGSGLFTVPAGTTKAVTLKVNLAVGTSASKAFNFGILSAADVTTNGAAVSGSFPITGNTMSTAQVSDLGKLTVATSTSPSAPNPGAVAHSLQKFTLAAVDQNVQVESIKLTIIGTVDAADIANFKLDVGGTQVGSTVAAMASDKTVTFDLSAAPYAIAKGNTKTLTLTGDVKSGTSRTFQVYIYNKEDVVAKDTEYGVYITPNQANTWTRLSGTA
ncbi:MAG: hypothetical protein NT091_01815, partial [Candidatus Falkowbacteria bacterium]|nr:hypothetical protein [Candidatus Falkowbacteria bacterium]